MTGSDFMIPINHVSCFSGCFVFLWVKNSYIISGQTERYQEQTNKHVPCRPTLLVRLRVRAFALRVWRNKKRSMSLREMCSVLKESERLFLSGCFSSSQPHFEALPDRWRWRWCWRWSCWRFLWPDVWQQSFPPAVVVLQLLLGGVWFTNCCCQRELCNKSWTNTNMTVTTIRRKRITEM